MNNKKGDFMKRFLVLFLLALNISNAFPNVEKYSRQLVELNANYKQTDAYCDSLSLDPDVATLCKSKLKEKILQEFEERFNGIVNFIVQKTSDVYEAEVAEVKCKAEALKQITAINTEFPNEIIVGSENCKQLQSLIDNHFAKVQEAECLVKAKLSVDEFNATLPVDSAKIITLKGDETCKEVKNLLNKATKI